MQLFLYIATAAGFFLAAHSGGEWEIVRHTLVNQALTSIVVAEDVIMVGGRDGIRRSTDNGATWQTVDQGLSIRYVRWMTATRGRPEAILVGTEPAGIFVSLDRGLSFDARPEVNELRDRHGWRLPYSPAAGCIRGFAVADGGSNPRRVYAAAEVGGVLVSDDGGGRWRLAGGSDGNPDLYRDLGTGVHPDVHGLAVFPGNADLVLAASGGGLYRSDDGGQSWRNLYPSYTRAVWIDPANARHLVAGPADGVARNGRIEESFDGGRRWQPASEGLTSPWPRHMVERFVAIDTGLLTVLSNGELWLRSSGETDWRHILQDLPRVTAVAAVP
jgi:photosystem II stability/assembly factor-like uncharacterized protein